MRPPFPLGLDGTEAEDLRGKNFLLNYSPDEIQDGDINSCQRNQIKGIYWHTEVLCIVKAADRSVSSSPIFKRLASQHGSHWFRIINSYQTFGYLLNAFWCIPGIIDVFCRKPAGQANKRLLGKGRKIINKMNCKQIITYYLWL